MENDLNRDKLPFGMSWGSRIYAKDRSIYFISAGTLFLPYSLVSVIQHYQSEVRDQAIQQFYASDLYLLDGKNPLHKFMNDPIKT